MDIDTGIYWSFDSWVKKYDLLCTEKKIEKRNYGQTLALLVSPTSFLLTSSLADHIGRKRTMIINSILFVGGLLVTLMVKGYLWKMLSFGIMSSVDGVYYQLIVIGSLENFSATNRYIPKIENLIYIFNAFGCFLVGFSSYYFTDTDTLLVFFMGLGALSSIPLLIVFKESVYFSMKNGRVSKALTDLRHIYLKNHPKVKNNKKTNIQFLKDVNYPLEKLVTLHSQFNPYVSKQM